MKMKPQNELYALEKRVAEKSSPAGHFLERAEARWPGEQLAVVKGAISSTKVGEQQREEQQDYTETQRAIFDQMPNNHERKQSKGRRQ